VSEIRIVVRGVDELSAAFEAMVLRFDAAAEQIVQGAGDIIAGKAKDTERWRGDSSALPMPPKPTQRTGATRNSIRTRDVKREELGSWSSNVRPTTEYARRLELGYPKGNKSLPTPGAHYERGRQPTRPFPYLSPAFEASRDEVIEFYNRRWLEAMEG